MGATLDFENLQKRILSGKLRKEMYAQAKERLERDVKDGKRTQAQVDILLQTAVPMSINTFLQQELEAREYILSQLEGDK